MTYYYGNCDIYGYPSRSTYWWGAPYGLSDYELYDYNNNFVLGDNENRDAVSDNIASDYGITMSDQNNIDVKVKDGVATLSGALRNPRTKPLANSEACRSSSVLDVEN